MSNQLENLNVQQAATIALDYYKKKDVEFNRLIKVTTGESTMYFENAHCLQMENWIAVTTRSTGPWMFSEEESEILSFGPPEDIEYLDEMP